MICKHVMMSLSLIVLLPLTGCADTSDEVDNNGKEQVSTNEESDVSFEDNFPDPPTLSIQVGEETLSPVPGTYSWSVYNEDGTITATEVDIAPPPELVRTADPIQVTEDTSIELDFEEEPDRYSVRIWNEENIVTSESDEVDLSGGGKVIYEVLAHWGQGSATYAFSLIIE